MFPLSPTPYPPFPPQPSNPQVTEISFLMMKILTLKSEKLKLIPRMLYKCLFLDLDWLPCIYVTMSAMLRSIPT